MAFIAARQLFPVDLPPKITDYEDLTNILNNSQLSNYFLTLSREVIPYSDSNALNYM